MTLAVVLSFCAFLSTPFFSGTAPIWAQTAPQETSPQKPSDSSTQTSGDSAKPQTPVAAQAPSTQTKAVGKPATRKVKKSKKNKTAKCADPAPAGSNTSTPSPANGDAVAATPCPPPITVVHDGGATDPAIKLSGGAEGTPSSTKRTPDQLVVSTEENLKKVEGRELNPSQKEMLTQIHQFLEQSKAATAAGDIDRGHNLALKARLLSDELTKP